MSSLIKTSHPVMGSWEKVYWTKGAAAAESYCARKSAGWESAERTAQHLLELNQQTTRHPRLKNQLTWLKADYSKKKERYQKEEMDPDLLPIAQRITNCNRRGQPGRTPFHRPSFRKRFQTAESLEKYVLGKVTQHERCYNVLRNAQKFLSLTPTLSVEIKEMRRYHLRAYRKWSSLRVCASELLPIATVPPLELMKIEKVHASGYQGARGSSTLFHESGVDHTHPALKGIYLTQDLIETSQSFHGTHVCGIIAAAAPLGHIVSLNRETSLAWQRPLSGIINWSGRVSFDEKKLMRDWYSKYFPATDETLVIQSCGNFGTLVDRNAFELSTFVNPVLSDASRSSSWIFVVNLQQNGLYPSRLSNLPGRSCAERAICAIGTDIYSAVPNNAYATKSGTSMAAPFVTGVAMMVQGAFPGLGMDEIRYALLHGATPIIIDDYGIPHRIERCHLADYSQEQIARSREIFGMGLLNAEGAMSVASELSRMKDQILEDQKRQAQDLFERVWGTATA
ncbi:MAG: S8 family serine peptidase [Rhabdochlamydiaceae bacterium]|nr:S8 family serine peptidase [Rhabdochlamydiaceae bacterium]